jgi:uncharacterized protein YndB with AHSA1/START domain
MAQRNVTHATFSLERILRVPPARVFAAFTDREAKDRWFGPMENWELLEREFDVRPGGRERAMGRWASGRVSDFDARYFDVVPDARLVYAYEMHIDGVKISVSLATVEIRPEGTGARLTITEQGAFLDGYDDNGAREHGTNFLVDRLIATLETEDA